MRNPFVRIKYSFFNFKRFEKTDYIFLDQIGGQHARHVVLI